MRSDHLTISTLAGAFRDERRFYRLLLVFAAITAVLKGLRMPYSWPATQAQLDYRNGFIRRGMFGEVCRRLHIPVNHYLVFSLLAFLLLAALLGLLTWSVRRSGFDALALGSFSALLASGIFVSLLVNVVGYLEIVHYLLVLLVFQLRNPRWQLLGALAAGILGVLFHELYALAFLPLSLTGAVYWATETTRPHAMRWAAISTAAALPWVLVFGLARGPSMTPVQITVLERQIDARTDFRPYDVLLEAMLTESDGQNRARMMKLMSAGNWWGNEAVGVIAFLPTAIFFLMVAWRLAGPGRRAVRWYFVLSTMAPLALNLAAYDRYRWLMMMTLNAALCVIAASWWNQRTQSDVPAPQFDIAWRRAAVFLLAVNLSTDVGFFAGHARSFPFVDFLKSYQSAKQEHRPWLWPPEIGPKQ